MFRTEAQNPAKSCPASRFLQLSAEIHQTLTFCCVTLLLRISNWRWSGVTTKTHTQYLCIYIYICIMTDILLAFLIFLHDLFVEVPYVVESYFPWCPQHGNHSRTAGFRICFSKLLLKGRPESYNLCHITYRR